MKSDLHKRLEHLFLFSNIQYLIISIKSEQSCPCVLVQSMCSDKYSYFNQNKKDD